MEGGFIVVSIIVEYLWNLRKTPEETARKIEFMTNHKLYGCH